MVAGVADLVAKLQPFGFLDVFERRRNYAPRLALDTTPAELDAVCYGESG